MDGNVVAKFASVVYCYVGIYLASRSNAGTFFDYGMGMYLSVVANNDSVSNISESPDVAVFSYFALSDMKAIGLMPVFLAVMLDIVAATWQHIHKHFYSYQRSLDRLRQFNILVYKHDA